MKRGKKNEWEFYLNYHIEDLENFRIPHNKVLIEMDPEAGDKTVGGILTAKDHDLAAHAIRWGVVKKLPERLYCQVGDPGSMPWECSIDIQVGDEVCMIHQDSYHAYPFIVDGLYHRLVNYEGIVLAKRGSEIVMCNGYLLMEKVMKTIKFGAFEKEVEDKRYGIIKAAGKPNGRYKTWDRNKKKEVLREDSQAVFNPGDRVFIHDIERVFDLEDWAHAILEDRKIFNVASRRRIGAIME